MEEKQKKVGRWWRVVFWIIVACLIAFWLNSWKNETSVPTQAIEQAKKTTAVQERINRINEVFTEEEAFEKAEEIGSNTVWIFFTRTPNEDIETITRGQAVNLSNEVNGVASVKTYVWWIPQMFCTATKWQVNDCSDYR